MAPQDSFFEEEADTWFVIAEFRANIQKNQKRRAQEQRQKEAQKREAEKENRRNLVGVRVVQKNLVYITGLAPTVREDELLKTLRKPEFFGQYGNIQKISISNRKSPDGQPQSLGIYVTFEKPEEATRCIQAVHGSTNGDRYLKAQHGTTKYCSAWLKNEKCNNPGCMFLHEQGDDEDSYTRQDLSSMNSIHTQRPLPGGGSSSRTASRQQMSHPTPPPASQAMARSSSKDGSEGGVDASALPSSANWARNPQRSRRGSHATSGAAPSPVVSASVPATSKATEEVVEDTEQPSSPQDSIHGGNGTETTPLDDLLLRYPEGSLKSLIDALQSWTMPNFTETLGDMSEYPPLFDVRGGERRRTMREDEDMRLDGDQDDQGEAQEPSEGEPETGGSLALGGEPEEREASSETHGFDQRRPGTQPPIQRGSTDGLFGPAIGGSNFGQSSSNPVGRTMTPQQLFSLRSQGGFGDQMPPGIPNQNNGFSSQGHNRQSSRFSFANESGNSATNVKLAANPRIMAQQSSMMPNTFQSQGGNQFYGTSMPGPPPGLKSTGTPPSMFGQGGFSGSGFGGAPKDSPNELLQSLIGRNRGGNNQAHDAGKREYMISSFSNQYLPPSTSTPAPAPGLLASLYGNQPGAFQDFGSKQKKKGKKHRHANTSSSGGSGLVDLADPSILQARMQHQSQSNAGAGHGLFGGQSQDDELPSLDEATNSVDALVSDDTFDSIMQSGLVSHSSTGLSAPPGFDLAHGHSDATFATAAAVLPGSQRHHHIVPALPKMPPGLATEVTTPEQIPRRLATPSSSDAKRNIKVLAAESGLSKTISSQANPPLRGDTLQDEDFPALNAPKAIDSKVRQTSSPAPSVTTPRGTPVPKKEKSVGRLGNNGKAPESPSMEAATPNNKGSVRRLPALNTQMVASPSPAPKAEKMAATPEKPATASAAAFPPLPTPSAGSSSPAAARPAPKTLRVVPTPKTEVPPIASPVSAVSRAMSLSNIRPDTPLSEMVSDTASMVSASVSASRAGSPPPSKIGTAAIRATTKSQQRKQRKEALKQDTKLIAEAPKVDPEEHAPVLGRKKKQKKEKPPPKPAPSKSKVLEPAPELTKDKDENKELGNEEPEAKRMGSDADLAKESEPRQSEKGKTNGKSSEKAKEPEKPKPKLQAEEVLDYTSVSNQEQGQADSASERPDTPELGPMSVFNEIKNSLWASAIDRLHMLRPVTSNSSRTDHGSKSAAVAAAAKGDEPAPCKDCACKCGEIQDADLAALRAGKPVRKQFHVDGSRMLITPNGDCIRGLSAEEEDAFLQLQGSIATDAEHPGAFVFQRHQPGNGAFSLIKGRAVPNGRPNIFPATTQPQSQDPIGKLQREDALSYINQYVLPRLNLGATNVGWPKGATVRQDAAAASLNSLAPYFYGPDAAAGVGIYSAPDSKDFAPTSSTVGPPSEDGAKCGGTGVSGMPLMSVEDAEAALGAARKETEKLEKKLNALIKTNKRVLVGTGS
ncbi:transcriptional repressor general negative regulator of transcription subunit 4 [Amphichorda felina]